MVEAGLTQEVLAEKSGVRIATIARALDIEVRDLLE
jgi:transcriptional regulator with XRE-family HTH domain